MALALLWKYPFLILSLVRLRQPRITSSHWKTSRGKRLRPAELEEDPDADEDEVEQSGAENDKAERYEPQDDEDMTWTGSLSRTLYPAELDVTRYLK